MLKTKHVHDKGGMICNHVQKGKRPLRLVAHDDEGIWQLMCGMDDHGSAKQAKPTCITCALEKFGGGLTKDAVPAGHVATRGNSKGAWKVREMNQDERDAINDESDGKVHTR